jgi:hypothetical protein
MINFLRLHPFQTAISARQETNFPAYLKTTRSRIKKSELNNRCAANKIFLTAQNKQQRVMFAQEYIHQNMWDAVVFSDKKTFQSSNSGRLGVYRLAGTRHNEEYGHATNRSGRFAVNVWGCISIRGPGVCAIVEERLRAPVHVRILREIMLPSVTHVFGERNFIFQDDNCRVHRAFLNKQGLRTVPWPSKSPDLNPIENIWGRMTSIMYKNHFRPNTVEQLQQKIVDTWHEVSPEYTRELVSSMPRRLQMVIDNNGAMTKYIIRFRFFVR